MTYLIDTHVIVWLLSEPEKISNDLKEFLKDSSNEILVSIVSFWELQIKINLGKMTFDFPFNVVHAKLNDSLSFQLLDLKLSHIDSLQVLPSIHKDPFDRILLAQCLVEDCAFVTSDRKMDQYPVPIVWK